MSWPPAAGQAGRNWVPRVWIFRPGSDFRGRRLLGLAIILCAAAVAVLPQLLRGDSCGHDFDFHLVAWMDALNSWRHGIAYPHWAVSANYGAGEPRFVFYPPLTWMLGAALGWVLPWQLVPLALIFLLLAATGLATRWLARQVLSDGASTLAGCAAIFSGYALFTAYERSAFGELAGGFWIPLLLLFILRDRNPAASLGRRALDGSALPLALVVTGCWLSNAPLGVMASYLLAAVALVAALLARSWAPVLRAAAAAALGTALAGLYLLPAIFEQRWVDIRQAIDDPGLRIENSWLFARHADPALAEHDAQLLKVSLLAVGMIAVALAGAMICWKRRRLQDRRWALPLAMIPVLVLLLQFPFSLPVWNLLPKLRFLQFPWRWLVVLESPLAIFVAAALWSRRPKFRLALVAGAAACFLAVLALANHSFYQVCYPEDTVPGVLATLNEGVDGYDEYAPPGADNTLIATGMADACLVTDPALKLGVIDIAGANPDWWKEQGSCDAVLTNQVNAPEHKRLRAVVSHAGFLILRLRSYPAWRVTVNEQPVNQPQRDDGLMVVPVAQGPVDLRVDWTATPDVLAGRWISGLAALLLLSLFFVERKLGRSRLS